MLHYHIKILYLMTDQYKQYYRKEILAPLPTQNRTQQKKHLQQSDKHAKWKTQVPHHQPYKTEVKLPIHQMLGSWMNNR